MTATAIMHLETGVAELADASLAHELCGNELRELYQLRAQLDAQISRRLRAFDQSKEFVLSGDRSAASWLRKTCRLHGNAANEAVKVARQVAAMPLARDAWEAGAITTGHVEVLARTRRAARANERFAATEPALVEVAIAASPADLANVGRQWRDALDAERQTADTLAAHHYLSRHLDVAETIDKMVYVNGLADAEQGSYIRRAVDNEVERQRKANDDREPGQLRMDALAAICRRDLDRLPLGSNRPHVMVHGDVGTIMGEHVGLCETDRGVRIAPETLRRIACDAFISTAAVDATSAVLDLGRAVRSFTAAQRRAILAQYPRCIGLGCAIPGSECQLHHIDWWDRDHGPTDVGNGVPVCSHDHHLLHELGWTIERDAETGRVTWFRPDGRPAGVSTPRAKPPPIALERQPP